MKGELVTVRAIHVFMHPFFAHGRFAEDVHAINENGSPVLVGERLQELAERKHGSTYSRAEREYERRLKKALRRAKVVQNYRHPREKPRRA